MADTEPQGNPLPGEHAIPGPVPAGTNDRHRRLGLLERAYGDRADEVRERLNHKERLDGWAGYTYSTPAPEPTPAGRSLLALFLGASERERRLLARLFRPYLLDEHRMQKGGGNG